MLLLFVILQISDVTLTGADDGVDGLSDVEIIYLGFGLIILLLLIIVVIVLVSDP